MSKRRRFWIATGLVLLVLVCASPLFARQSRLSAAVALVNKGPVIEPFLLKPAFGYVQGYVRFGDDFPDDVIIVLDQEFIEGVEDPLFVKGGDWMALIGIQRTGIVWVGAGTDKTMNGNPSSGRDWKTFDLKTALLPNRWYLLRIEANFETRHFKNFTISGPNINQTLDLSSLPVDYPNYMPFSTRLMGYFAGAMRGRDMMKVEGTPIAYFDDIEGGVIAAGKSIPVFTDGFEKQTSITEQPITSPTIDFGKYRHAYWYREQPEALFSIEKSPFARSGFFVGVSNVRLN